MPTLTMRPYCGESDLHPITHLLNHCCKYDQEDEFTTPEDLRQSLTAPDCNPTEDVRLWESTDGEVVGYAAIWLPEPSELDTDVIGHLFYSVHPEMRYQGLEQDMLAWARDRTLSFAQSQSCTAKLRVFCREQRQEAIALYKQEGFEFERSFLRMARSLTEPLPEVCLPDGFTLIDGQQMETAAWVDMHNQTFIDHWNFYPLTVEQAEHHLSKPNYRPDLDLVAIAPDGTYAAFCYGHIYVGDNQRNQRQDGWINILGTRRGYRRMGLGRSMLLLGLARLQAAGMTTALLGVDSQNPNHAYRLYDEVGFRKQFASFGYVKSLAS